MTWRRARPAARRLHRNEQRALADTDIKLDGQIEADEPAALLTLIGLDRIAAAGGRPARLKISAHGPPSRNFAFDGNLDAGPIAAGAKGVLRLPADQPAELSLDQIAGTVGGGKVQGRLALRFEDVPRVEGSFDAETLDAPATIAAAVGMPRDRGATPAAGWSTDPQAWGLPGLIGQIAFKAQRAVFGSGLIAQQLHGVARFDGAGLVFEDVAGEMAKGRFEGRLAFATGNDGLTARVRVGLRDAEAAAIFLHAEAPAVAGRLSVQGEVEGAGRSPAAFMGSLAGYGAVTLERGQIAGINPGVFDTVSRAVEIGLLTDDERIRSFVTGVLDATKVPIAHTTMSATINAAQARFEAFGLPLQGGDLKANAGINLVNGTLDALLTLSGPASASGTRIHPTLLIGLNGPALAPARTIDISLISSWLTLLTVEQHSRQIEAMEKAAREKAARDAAAAMAAKPTELAPQSQAPAPVTKPADAPTGMMSGEMSPGAQAPALPPAVTVPPLPRPRPPPRAEGGSPPALVGAQN